MTERIENIAQMAAIVNDGKVLAMEFNNYEGAPIEGKWVLPGGRPDVGENIYEALKREVREETGWDVDVVEPICIHNFKNWNGLERIRLSYLCKAKDLSKEIVLSHEHKSYRWVTKEESDLLDWINFEFKEIVQKAIEKDTGERII